MNSNAKAPSPPFPFASLLSGTSGESGMSAVPLLPPEPVQTPGPTGPGSRSGRFRLPSPFRYPPCPTAQTEQPFAKPKDVVRVVGIDPAKSHVGIWVADLPHEVLEDVRQAVTFVRKMRQPFLVWTMIDVASMEASSASYASLFDAAMHPWSFLWDDVDVVGVERQEDCYDKMVGYMIAAEMYFLAHCPRASIRNVHSKLKFHFDVTSDTLVYQEGTSFHQAFFATLAKLPKNPHDRNKKYLVHLTSTFVVPLLHPRDIQLFTQSKKKDDLSDALLIGLLACRQWLLGRPGDTRVDAFQRHTTSLSPSSFSSSSSSRSSMTTSLPKPKRTKLKKKDRDPELATLGKLLQ